MQGKTTSKNFVSSRLHAEASAQAGLCGKIDIVRTFVN